MPISAFGWVDHSAPDIDAANLEAMLQQAGAYTDAAIAAAGGGALTATAGRTSTIGSPVLRDIISVKDYGAKGGAKALTSGATTTATSTAFTDTTNAPFTSADTGKTILIPGAGTGGRNFSATITYVSPSQVTLASAATSSVSNGAYQYGWNDTTAIQAAATAAAGAVLDYGNDAYLWTSITPKPGTVHWGYGTTVWKIPGNNSLWYESQSDGSTIHKGFVCVGFNAHGEGQLTYTTGDQQTQNAVYLGQWANVICRDLTLDGFINCALECRDSQNVYFLDNTVTNSCINQGRNVFNFGDTTFQTSSTPNSGFYCIGNTISNCKAAGVCLASSLGPESVPMNAFIANNTITQNSTFACVAVEINSNVSGVNARRISIVNNLLDQQSTASNNQNCCIIVTDDAASGWTNDPTKIEDIIVSGNTCTTAATATAGNGLGAITIGASRVTCNNNNIVANGTNNRCILVKNGSDPTVYTNLAFNDNNCTTTSTGGVNNIVEIQNATHWSYLGGIISSASTTSGDGFKIGGGTSFWTVGGGLRIETPAANGLNISVWKDGKIDGLTIYDVNNSNGAGTSAYNGLYYSGTNTNMAGTLNEIYNLTIYDDRGTHQMGLGIQGPSSAATTKAIVRGLRISGCTNNPLNTNVLANMFAEFSQYSSDDLVGYGLDTTTGTFGASPVTTTVQPYDQACYVRSIGGATAITESRSSHSVGVNPGMYYIKRGESLTITWATTAPTYTLVPVF